MKKIFFVLSFFAMGLVSCSSCTKKDQVTPSVCDGAGCPIPSSSSSSVPTPATQTINGSDFEFTIPLGWDKMETNKGSPVELSYFNSDKKNLILVIKEVWPGTLDSYTIETLRALKDTGANVGSIKQVTLNGQMYRLFEADKSGTKIWVWATYRNNTGYAFSCGGPTTDPWQQSFCESVANSFRLK